MIIFYCGFSQGLNQLFEKGGGPNPIKTGIGAPSKTCERGGGAIFLKELSILSEYFKRSK